MLPPQASDTVRRRAPSAAFGALRTRATALASLVLLAACGGGSGGSAPPTPLLPNGVQQLAAAKLGPAGGTVEVATGDFAGAAVDVAPGALASEVDVAIGVRERDPQFPFEFPVWTLVPPTSTLGGSVDLTVRLGLVHQLYVSVLGLEVDVFRRTTRGGFVPMPTVVRDPQARTVTARIDRFGEFVALDSTFYRLLAQGRGPIDPASAVETAFAAGADLVVEEGDAALQVGQGSLAGFWSSTSARNVLVVHGFNSSPLEFLDAEDVLTQLATRYQNVVAYQYPSGRSIAENGLALFDEIRAFAQPGFSCSIVAHSMGGLVARHALEQAHLVRGRASLADDVAVLVTLGTPHGGTGLADEFARLFTLALPVEQQAFVQGATDLGANSAFLAALNGSYVDNPTAYFQVAGDIGGGTDGVVTVASATQTLPVGPGEDVLVVRSPSALHSFLHTRAQSLGVMARIFDWLP